MTSPYLPVSSRLQCSGVAYPNLATVQFKARGPCVAGIPGYYAPPLECSTEPSQLGNLHVMVFNKLVSECRSILFDVAAMPSAQLGCVLLDMSRLRLELWLPFRVVFLLHKLMPCQGMRCCAI
jgi:hypothetical protein